MKKMTKFLMLGGVVLLLMVLLWPQQSKALVGVDIGQPRQETIGERVRPVSQFPPAVEGDGIDRSRQSSSSSDTGIDASSAQPNGEIFNILQRKMYTTLKDLRQIVYVIAGFGLIMFACLAIFNKISYKHLGYIMIGLSLLSLMFPFLEYFSGYSLEDAQTREMTFRNYLNAQGEIECAECEAILNEQPNAEAPTGEDEDDIAVAEAEEPAPTQRYSEAVNNKLSAAGCSQNTESSKSAWDPKTLRRNVCTVDENGNVSIVSEVCQGGKVNKKGECAANLVNTMRNIAEGARKGVAAVQSGIGAITSAANVGVAALSGVRGVYNAAANGNWNVNSFGDLQNIGNNIMSIVGAGASGMNNTTLAFSSGAGALRNAGDSAAGFMNIVNTNYENNPTGQNSFSSGWQDGAFRQGVVTTDQQANAINNAGQDVARSGNAAVGQTNNLINTTSSLGNKGSNIGNQYGNIFDKSTWGKRK